MTQYISILFFALLSIVALYFFYVSASRIRKNVLLGKDIDLSDNKPMRWKTMAKVALGQSKMTVRPVAAFFHLLVYAGFVLINLEVLEIFVDGFTAQHRTFAPYLGSLYSSAIAFFEVLAVLVIIACVVFLLRRNTLKIARFQSPELKGWPVFDANTILIVEIVLMTALLIMNATDRHFLESHSMPISSFIAPLFSGLSDSSAYLVMKTAWWFHFVGILIFLNYVPYSKHLHIFLAFPNTFYSNLKPKGQFDNNEMVANEVKAMMDPSFTPPVVENPRFGVKDVEDLNWKNLLDAYSCTECGRCTSVCPANITGKLLSPRKVMMDTRDRLEEVGKIRDGKLPAPTEEKDLHSYISKEELLACTTCNACAEACPININPVEIIVGMRQYQIMEKSDSPSEWNIMFNNMENNGAPWQFAQSEKMNWAEGE
jgi:heterodisulfide reductase subunit C